MERIDAPRGSSGSYQTVVKGTVTHKLLLADDSVTIQRVVELTFSGENVQVVTVGDGEQAIARIPVERPDVVLADIGMPKRTGYDVSAFVKGRADLSHIPVLLLAGAFEPVDDARAQQVKCDGVLVKPFEPQQVVSRVRALIEAGKTRALPAAFTLDRTSTAPEGEQTAPQADDTLDDYFEGLDAALAGLDNTKDEDRQVAAPDPSDFRMSEVPTLEGLLGPAPAREPSGPAEPAFVIGSSMMEALSGHPRTADPPVATPPGGGGNIILDAFNALLAMEQGEPRPAVSMPTGSGSAIVTDELVDTVTRRVIERLAPNAANDLVKQVVADVAERLIREEIARIKTAANTKR